jgi:hypothetical protein
VWPSQSNDARTVSRLFGLGFEPVARREARSVACIPAEGQMTYRRLLVSAFFILRGTSSKNKRDYYFMEVSRIMAIEKDSLTVLLTLSYADDHMIRQTAHQDAIP